MALG
jgi:hypothetical protein